MMENTRCAEPNLFSFAIRLRYELRKNLSKFLFQYLNLYRELKSGLTVRVESRSDWTIYNEVFVDKEYDLAIQKALESLPHDYPNLNILDLGANVGFFAFRAADIILQSNAANIPFQLTLVEGSPTVHKELESRMLNQPSLSNQVRVIHGLIGEREGSAKIFESVYSGTNSLKPVGNMPSGIDVPYIDLEALYDEDAEIDLLKCDIEGSELSFLQNYKHLLSRVKNIVFEFHHKMCDIKSCYEILREAGFYNHKVLSQSSLYSISTELFWK
jgi:FkbM family methyltransferase